MENPNPRPKNNRPSAEEMAMWNKKLADEGMPDEIIEQKSEAHTEAYESALNDAYVYYATHDTANFSAHRTKFQELMTEMRSRGASDEELEEFADEDSMRAIEDRATELSRTAVMAAMDVVRLRPMLANRPEAITKLVTEKLLQEAPEIPKETLIAFAQRAAESNAVH